MKSYLNAISLEDMICDCINNAGIDYQVFKEDLQKSKLTDSLKGRSPYC